MCYNNLLKIKHVLTELTALLNVDVGILENLTLQDRLSLIFIFDYIYILYVKSVILWVENLSK